MRYDWQSGETIRRARCFDRDTGEELSPMLWVDEDAGLLERIVMDAAGKMQIDSITHDVKTVMENRRVRILWEETQEEAEAREALTQHYIKELRAGRELPAEAPTISR